VIRVCEAVLPGHPDKFCDQIADAIVAAASAVEPDAYCQTEVCAWSNEVFLTGGIATRAPFTADLGALVRRVAREVGYCGGNWIDGDRYRVTDTICRVVADPTRWTRHVNDQSIVVGHAWGDARTHYLPPETFLAHAFRRALTDACRDGELRGEGPDGKLLVRMRLEGGDSRARSAVRLRLEHVLVTLQHREETEVLDLAERVAACLGLAYAQLADGDGRWCEPWSTVDLDVNPNGPLLNGGSDGDNGQTGRKLVMDYYGPHVPIGGGALSGKHLTHIDRLGACAARHAAVRAVAGGAGECTIRVAYAPNVAVPLEVTCEMSPRGPRAPREFFDFDAMADRYASAEIDSSLARGDHFFDLSRPWNRDEPQRLVVTRSHCSGQ